MEGSSKVIKIIGDTTQYLSSIKTIEQANSRMLQHMGAESASVAKVVSSNLAKIGQTQIFDPQGTKEQVKVLSELNTVVQMTDGSMGTFKESMIAMDDGSTKVSASYKELATSAKTVGTAQDGLVGKSSQLATNFGSVADTTQKFSNELQGFGGITRVVGQNVTEMSNGMTKTGVVVKTASGNFVQLRETVKTLPGGIQQVTRSAKDVSAQFKKTAIEAEKAKKSNQSLGESLAFITKRALITIPAWMILRSVWMGLTRTVSSSIKFLIDWEYQMAQIRIVNNATASEMKTLSSALLSIGKDFGIATDAMGEGCFDKETEILTEEGWKFFSELQDKDKVATMNPEDRQLKFSYPKKIIQYHYDGPMYAYKDKIVDFKVTPNHRFIYRDSHLRSKFKMDEIQNITYSKWYIPITSYYTNTDKVDDFIFESKNSKKRLQITPEIFMEFLGWYISEGCIYKEPNRPDCWRIKISQVKPDNRIKIDKMLKILNGGYARSVHCFSFVNKALGKYLVENCYVQGAHRDSFAKKIPAEIKKLDAKYLKILLEALVLGDGHQYKNSKGIGYFTSSKQLANDVHEIAVKCGYSVKTSQSKKGLYHLYLSLSTNRRIYSEKIQKVPYNDNVYCVNVEPYNTIFVRRNGSSYWTLNSKLYAQQGRAMNEIIPLMRTTAKLSLLTGNTMVQSVEDLTAITKAFNITAENSVNIVDSMTATILRHAVTAQDLASAYKQTASTASALGVSFSELTGYITAIKAVTRDSGSKIGLSLRTMFSRITTSSAQSIQNLASVPLYLDSMGKATFSVTPRMRNLGSIISELALKFKDLGNAQQSQLASLVGGVRRQNQVFALFNNFTEAVEAQTDSLFGLGRADSAVSTLTETSKIGIDGMKNAWASFVDSVLNTSAILGALKGITNAISFIEKALSPDKAQFRERVDAISDQNDEYARQIQLAEGVNEVLRKTQELDELTFRATPKQMEEANKLLEIYKTRAEDALKLEGIEADFSNVIDINSFKQALMTVKNEVDTLQLDAQVGQQLNNIESQILSTGQVLADTFRNIRTSDYGKELGKGRLTGDAYREIYEIARELDALDTKFKKGVPLDSSAFVQLNKIIQETTALTDEQRVGAQRTLREYELQSEKLSDVDKTKKEIVKTLQEEQTRIQALTLDYEKQKQIANIILDDHLKRLQLQGKSNAEILQAEIYRRKQLGLDGNEIDNLQRKLALERERSKEKRLQNKIGSESEKLYDIAQESGFDIARQIGDVLSGEVDFSNFVRRGGEAVDIFKDKFADVFKQQQMQAFFKGDTVPGLEGLRGGSMINIAEQGLRTPVSRYDSATEIRRQRAEAEILKTQTPATQAFQTNVEVNMPIEVNVEANAEQVEQIARNVVSRELPVMGSKLNRALVTAQYNKQTNTV